jgi:hypothetical protein
VKDSENQNNKAARKRKHDLQNPLNRSLNLGYPRFATSVKSEVYYLRALSESGLYGVNSRMIDGYGVQGAQPRITAPDLLLAIV